MLLLQTKVNYNNVGVGRELVPRIGSNGYILIVQQAAAAPTPI